MDVRTLEGCSIERIDRETGIIVDTVEDRTQNAILIAIHNIITPRIELVVRSINASSGRDAAIVTAKQNVGKLWGLLPLLKTYPKEQHTSWTNCICWDSGKRQGRGKWIIGPKNTSWPTIAHSLQNVRKFSQVFSWSWEKTLVNSWSFW